MSDDITVALYSGMGNIGVFLVVSGEIDNIFADDHIGLATLGDFFDFEIRRLQEAVVIDFGV